MSAVAVSARWLMLAALVLLVGCRAAGPRPDAIDALAGQVAREAALAALHEWDLQGRLAVSNGEDGGSGTLRWTQSASGYEFEVKAPVTRQSWRLQVTPAGARLEGLEGGVREDPDPVLLLAREVGWVLPLADLAYWVRGMRGAGPSSMEFANDGLPHRLNQAGWTVTYRDWDRRQQPPLPSRVFAQRGEQRVRLAIQRWSPAVP